MFLHLQNHFKHDCGKLTSVKVIKFGANLETIINKTDPEENGNKIKDTKDHF
jgi:hypothetical protein